MFKKIKIPISFLMLFLVSALLVACGDDGDIPGVNTIPNISDIIGGITTPSTTTPSETTDSSEEHVHDVIKVEAFSATCQKQLNLLLKIL